MLDEAAKRLADEVAEVAGNVGSGKTYEGPIHGRQILALFDRCRSTFGAVRLLAKQEQPDFGQEATALARSLISESLMLMELADADERRRVTLIVGWELASVYDLEGLLREAVARGHDVSFMLEPIPESKRRLEAYAREHGAGARKWRVDEKALADKFGREDYLMFRFMHHLVHGSAFALAQRYSQENGAFVIGGPAADPHWGNAAALLSASSVAHATRAVCKIFGWDPGADLDDLQERIDAVVRELL